MWWSKGRRRGEKLARSKYIICAIDRISLSLNSQSGLTRGSTAKKRGAATADRAKFYRAGSSIQCEIIVGGAPAWSACRWRRACRMHCDRVHRMRMRPAVVVDATAWCGGVLQATPAFAWPIRGRGAGLHPGARDMLAPAGGPLRSSCRKVCRRPVANPPIGCFHATGKLMHSFH